MKIALLNDQLNAGGAEKVLVNMANMLHQKGVDVLVVLYLEPAVIDGLLHTAIPVHYLHRRGRFDFKAMRTLKKLVNHCDIVHVHSRYNLLYYLVSKIALRINKPRIVFHEHLPRLSAGFAERWAMSKADAYVAVWETMFEWAKYVVKLKPEQFFYLANIIDAPAKPITAQPAGFKIISIGNHRRPKNHLFAVELLSTLPEQYTLHIYGAANEVVFFEEVNAAIAKYDLHQRVKLVTNVSSVYGVIGNYNLAIHTAVDETGPLVLLEYMYAGLPFIAYETGDVVKTIKPQLDELIMKTFDISEWKQAITGMLQNEKKRSEIRSKMKQLLEKEFSEAQYWSKLQEIYRITLS